MLNNIHILAFGMCMVVYKLSSSRRSVFCSRAIAKPLETIGSWKFQELRNCPKLGCRQIAPNRSCKSAPAVVVCTQRKSVPCSWIICNFLKNRNYFSGDLLLGSPRTVDAKNILLGVLTLGPGWQFAFSWGHLSKMPTTNHIISFSRTRNFIDSQNFF